MKLAIPIAFSALMSLASGPVGAAELGNAQAGRTMAQKACIECHVIAPGEKPQRLVGAPPFAELVQDPRVTAFRIRAFLRTPHRIMPNFILTAQETDDLVAYLLSLKPKPSP